MCFFITNSIIDRGMNIVRYLKKLLYGKLIFLTRITAIWDSKKIQHSLLTHTIDDPTAPNFCTIKILRLTPKTAPMIEFINTVWSFFDGINI